MKTDGRTQYLRPSSQDVRQDQKAPRTPFLGPPALPGFNLVCQCDHRLQEGLRMNSVLGSLRLSRLRRV